MGRISSLGLLGLCLFAAASCVRTDCAKKDPICGLGALTYLLPGTVTPCSGSANTTQAANYFAYYGSTVADVFTSVCPLASGDIVLSGRTQDIPTLDGITPLFPFQGGSDAFVARITPGGFPVFYAFFGTAGVDSAVSTLELRDGGLLLVGGAAGDIPTLDGRPPVNPSSGDTDALVIRLDANGALQWYSFLGTNGGSEGWTNAVELADGSLILGGSGTVNIPGIGGLTPLRAYAGGGADFLIARLSAGGVLEYYSFLGSVGSDSTADNGLLLTAGSDVILAGVAQGALVNFAAGDDTTPRFSPAGGSDAFFARLDPVTGLLRWHGFFGSGANDFAEGVAEEPTSGNLFFAVRSLGDVPAFAGLSPGNAYSSSSDGVVISLDRDGGARWYSFVGAGGFDGFYDVAYAPARDGEADGAIVLLGNANANIATLSGLSPLLPFNAGADAFVVRMDSNGGFLSYSFFGGANNESEIMQLRVLPSGRLLAGMRSNSALASFNGTAVRRPHNGGLDLVLYQLNANGGF